MLTMLIPPSNGHIEARRCRGN